MEGQLILQAGEKVLCLLCLRPLAIADRDIYLPASTEDLRLLDGATLWDVEEYAGGPVARASDRALACQCGGESRGARPNCLLVRSGAWTGWRPLEGE